MSKVRATDTAGSSPESGAGSPGAILRRCREFHGFTLEEAAETTKIGIGHLKALEADQIHEFANQVYLKGFLRIYAAYLGLNSDDVARMYEKLFGVQGDKATPADAPAIRVRSPRRLVSLKKLIFPAFLLAVILITATFFKQSPPPSVPQSQPVPAVIGPPLPQSGAVQPQQSSSRNTTVTQNKQPPKEPKLPVEPEPAAPEKTVVSKKQPADAAGFILRLKVIQNGTLTSTVDGSGPQQQELTIGDVIEWKAEKNVTLELSNAGGVEVELNGKPYKSLGAPDSPVYVEFNANGIIQ